MASELDTMVVKAIAKSGSAISALRNGFEQEYPAGRIEQMDESAAEKALSWQLLHKRLDFLNRVRCRFGMSNDEHEKHVASLVGDQPDA